MAADSISNRHGKKNKQPEKGKRADRQDETHSSAQSSEATRVGGTIAEATEQLSEYASEGAELIRHRAEEAVRGREGTVVFVSLAVGFGLGVLMGTTLAAPRRRP